ncbi:hypothetical protein [Streptomyces mirabilis]
MQESEATDYFNEEQISRISSAFDLKHVETADDFLIFDTLDTGIRRRDIAIPQDVAIEILKALERGAERMEEYEGWVDHTIGFAEFAIHINTIGALTKGRNDKFTFETRPCRHPHEASPPHEVFGDHLYPIWRVTSADGSTCIEISRNSPLSTPLLPLLLENRQSRAQSTLKVFSTPTHDKSELEHRSVQLANSFLFELNARNKTPYLLRIRQQPPLRPRRMQEISYSVRFPKTQVPERVAALFSIASDLRRGSYTTSVLSFYQILEYYLPAAHRREAVRKVRKLVRSLDFDEEKDSSILKILSSVERSHGASEGEQLRTLIEECVPEEKMREFFALDHGVYFGKRGPISGVPTIQPNSGESLASQVAKRVYALRNRIVHAKDDARYTETSVLLPTSHEARHLYPDMELIRMLAIEVIVDNR